MRKASLLLLVAAACSNNDNVVLGGVPQSTFTPFIQFDSINSVISGRLSLRDADGNPTGSNAEVVIISDRPRLCQVLAGRPDYFRNPPDEAFQALIIFLPDTDHLGTFFLARPSDAGTTSELIAFNPVQRSAAVSATGQSAPPFQGTIQDAVGNLTYVSLTDFSASAGGESVGSFYLNYLPPSPLTSAGGFPFSGKFRANGCPTLDGTLLP
jgi:hypothetical protein